MGVAHHMTVIDIISSVTRSYWVKNMHLSFGVSIKSTHELNGTERLVEIKWKIFEKDKESFDAAFIA